MKTDNIPVDIILKTNKNYLCLKVYLDVSNTEALRNILPDIIDIQFYIKDMPQIIGYKTTDINFKVLAKGEIKNG